MKSIPISEMSKPRLRLELQDSINLNKLLDERLTELEAQLAEYQKEKDILRAALIQHRADLHGASNRPCGTCQQSADALGIDVPGWCARPHLDKAALAKTRKPIPPLPKQRQANE